MVPSVTSSTDSTRPTGSATRSPATSSTSTRCSATMDGSSMSNAVPWPGRLSTESVPAQCFDLSLDRVETHASTGNHTDLVLGGHAGLEEQLGQTLGRQVLRHGFGHHAPLDRATSDPLEIDSSAVVLERADAGDRPTRAAESVMQAMGSLPANARLAGDSTP